MADGRLGRLGVWGHLDSLSVAEARAYAERIERLGFSALWVPETVGREPFTLLALLAGTTRTLRLGTSIASIWGRDAQTTRMAAMTLAEATRGRFVLGIGVSHAHLAGRLRGHEYDKPLTRMREYLAVYRRAIYKGPGQDDVAEPPVLLAALRDRMLDLAASQTDGAFPYLVTAERVGWMRQRLDANSAGDRQPLLAVTLPVVVDPDPGRAADAARAYLKPYLRTPNYRASWSEQGFGEQDWSGRGSDQLVDAMVARGGAREIRPRIDELHGAGADHVALIPLDALGVSEDLPALESLRPR